MKQYKPTTLEENYCNVKNLGNTFWRYINSFIWEYNTILSKYSDINRYNLLVSQGLVNPFLNNPESELTLLAYSIYGFTSHTFETLAYALDCWRIHVDSREKNRNVSNKQYDQGLELLVDKQKISRTDKEVLLDFRRQRNYCTHYGRICFCKFIFENSKVLYELIQVITRLLEQIDMDYDVISYLNLQYSGFIEEMKKVLDEYIQDNQIVA